MSLTTIIYANSLPVMAMIVMICLIKINPLFDRRQNKLFFATAIITLVMLVVISIDYRLSSKAFENAWIIRRFTSFLNFSTSPLILAFLLQIFSGKDFSKKLYVPFFINALICAASMFANIVFSISTENLYYRGPLFFVPFCTSLFYICMLIYQSLQAVHNRSRRLYEANFLLLVIVLLGLGMYLEIVQRFHFMSWDFAALSLVLYYTLLNINQSMFDHLTKTYNRAMYNKRIHTLNGNMACSIAVIDINNFKQINDVQGHDMGDQCLITFAEVLRKTIGRKDVLYRVGGDEFTVISLCMAVQLEETMQKSLESLKEHGISFAYGIKQYRPTEDIEKVIDEADKLMYVNKKTL